MHGKSALLDELGISLQGRSTEIHRTRKGLPGNNTAQGKKMVTGPASIKDYLDHKGIEQHQDQWIQNPPPSAKPRSGDSSLDGHKKLDAQGVQVVPKIFEDFNQRKSIVIYSCAYDRF